jgi:hypothetical protein
MCCTTGPDQNSVDTGVTCASTGIFASLGSHRYSGTVPRFPFLAFLRCLQRRRAGPLRVSKHTGLHRPTQTVCGNPLNGHFGLSLRMWCIRPSGRRNLELLG